MATIAFDVNGTLLSLAPLGPPLVAAVGGPDPGGEWFARVLHTSLVVDHLDHHEPFDRVARRALGRLAADRGLVLDPDLADAVVATMRRLPPHADVEAGLASLAAAGHRLVAFSNSSREALVAQLGHAGILAMFDEVVSVDGGGRFKPDPVAYVHLCRELDAFPDEVTLVAAHDWDVAGARAAGLHGVLLARRPDAWHLPGPRGAAVDTVAAVADVLGTP